MLLLQHSCLLACLSSFRYVRPMTPCKRHGLLCSQLVLFTGGSAKQPPEHARSHTQCNEAVKVRHRALPGCPNWVVLIYEFCVSAPAAEDCVWCVYISASCEYLVALCLPIIWLGIHVCHYPGCNLEPWQVICFPACNVNNRKLILSTTCDYLVWRSIAEGLCCKKKTTAISSFCLLTLYWHRQFDFITPPCSVGICSGISCFTTPQIGDYYRYPTHATAWAQLHTWGTRKDRLSRKRRNMKKHAATLDHLGRTFTRVREL